MFSKSSFKRYRTTLKSSGFSMLEAVVVVGVLLALAVGGFIAYSNVTENAKRASVETAAASIYTAIQVAQSDGDPATIPGDIIRDYNNSQDKITVVIEGYTESP